MENKLKRGLLLHRVNKTLRIDLLTFISRTKIYAEKCRGIDGFFELQAIKNEGLIVIFRVDSTSINIRFTFV